MSIDPQRLKKEINDYDYESQGFDPETFLQKAKEEYTKNGESYEKAEDLLKKVEEDMGNGMNEVEAIERDEIESADKNTVATQAGGNSFLGPDISQIVKLYDKFEDAKTDVLGPDDVLEDGNSKYVLKSGVRKLQRVFSISTEIVKMEKTDIDNKHYKYAVIARAIAPDGSSTECLGMVSTEDTRYYKGGDKDDEEKWIAPDESDVAATAQTKATNRAVMDLLGGEVSGEEIASIKSKKYDNADSEGADLL